MANDLVEGASRLSVLMPVFNEARTLRAIVGQVLAAPVELEIELVAVDDHSRDDSLAILEEMAASDRRIKVVHHPVNRGKGAAIRTAIEHMTGDIAIVQDSDLEYDPRDYPRVLKPILDGRADAVFGSRFAASDERRVLLFWHSLGNKVLTALSNMANDLNLTDMETCYKAVRADVLKRLRLTSERFGIEPEITARLAQWGARIYEVPISYHGRTYAEGKNIGWKDGVQALWLIFKFRFLDTRATDESAVATRQSLGRAPQFRRWLVEAFGDSLGDRVLEVEAGPGHLTAWLLDRDQVVSTDAEPVHVETLRRRFGHLANLEVARMNLDFEDLPRELTGKFDSVLLVDVLQRAEEPKVVLARAASAVRSGGSVLIHVPADSELFGATDRAAGHLRRFDASDLRELGESSGIELRWIRPFNALGRFGWRLHHAIGGARITTMQAVAFDRLVPLGRRLDEVGKWPGLSWIATFRVP